MAGRDGARAPRRPRVHPQVEHGLDARHARLPAPRSGAPQAPSPRADVRVAVRLHGELRACRCLTTRWCTARARSSTRWPATRWQKFANLRALYGWMWAYPGRKLLFMGSEIAQDREWHHDRSLDWHLLDRPEHAGVRDLVRQLNHALLAEPALWERDRDPAGFRWLDADDSEHSIYSFVRYSGDGRRAVACVANFTPVPTRGLSPRRAVPRTLDHDPRHERDVVRGLRLRGHRRASTPRGSRGTASATPP